MSNMPELRKAFALQTQEHIHQLRSNIYEFTRDLELRAEIHDYSKFTPEEMDILCTSKQTKFGSPEYEAERQRIMPALVHHYAKNSHHPEHYPNGIDGMDLCDVVEMLADWRAAWERAGRNVPWANSLESARQRFKVSDQLFSILVNSCIKRGWE